MAASLGSKMDAFFSGIFNACKSNNAVPDADVVELEEDESVEETETEEEEVAPGTTRGVKKPSGGGVFGSCSPSPPAAADEVEEDEEEEEEYAVWSSFSSFEAPGPDDPRAPLRQIDGKCFNL